jgi:hypothetical protein
VSAIQVAEDDVSEIALLKRGRRIAGLSLGLVATVLMTGGLATMRYVGRSWSEQDVQECQASAFVGDSQNHGQSAVQAAMQECLEHRRAKRRGPWGAFGSADDASKYNAADD